MPALLEDYSILEDLAAEVGVSARTIRRWAQAGSPALPIHRLGRRPLVARADFVEWLAAHRTQRNVKRGR